MRIALVLLWSCFAVAQEAAQTPLGRHVHAEMSFLAGDELQGRGSGTAAEATAAVYLASQLEAMGLEPAGDAAGRGHSWIQNVPYSDDQIEVAPTLKVGSETWTHGDQFAIARLTDANFTGTLVQWDPATTVRPGSVLLMPAGVGRSKIREALARGATAVLLSFGDAMRERFERSKALPKSLDEGEHLNVLYLSEKATAAIRALSGATAVSLHAEVTKHAKMTRNVIGVLPGQTQETIIISAHFDHLGVKPGQPDPIYNGADDDASGTVAVLEIARAFASGPKPRRTVYFILFGGEELGSVGGGYFQKHPVMPLENVVANVEFEMIGRADPKIAADSLWMTGFDRSDLGPSLAKRGARLVPDPHPEQDFFSRSDNYPLAKRGVVAHSVSSYGLHKQYHQPDDDLAHIDFDHMTRAIRSMIAPLRWLANTTYRPAWLPGKKP